MIDLFANALPDFSVQVDRIMAPVIKAVSTIRVGTRQDSFARFYISEKEIELKLEFVNDVPYRVGLPTGEVGAVRRDTWMNVLVNKVTALQRDAAKDLVDIYCLACTYSFSWEEVIQHAKQKDAWVNEIEVSMAIHNFDIGRLREVSFPVNRIIDLNTDRLQRLAKDALHGFDNSLFLTEGR